MLFDNFDEIRIINLAYRTDRRAEVLGELRRVGLEDDARVAFFDALAFDDAGPFSSKGARGAFYSHLAILEQAAANGRSVLILEDDVDFTSGVRDYELPEGWAIFYGGYRASDAPGAQDGDIIGSHMMGFTVEVVRHLASYLKTLSFVGEHPPIDGAYVWFRRENPNIRTVFAEPPLGNQRPSRTDVADLHLFDRLPGLRQVVAFARKLKRWLGFTRPSR